MTLRASFFPRRGANQVVTVTGAPASVSVDPVAKSVRLVNEGLNQCHVIIGTGAQTASLGGAPILPGTAVIFSKGDGEDTVAYVSASGGTTLNIQTGEGGN